MLKESLSCIRQKRTQKNGNNEVQYNNRTIKVPAIIHMYAHPDRNKKSDNSSFFAPPRCGGGLIVLPLSVRTSIGPSVTLRRTVLVSASPPTVFDAGI